jgi:ribosomal peptide maturation radical SAM protein 1
MRFRSKSQDRAFAELQHLAACWGTDILCVDNILDLDYLQEFLPRLARSRLGLSLHYEVKVNLSKAQLRVLADAGVSAIQPGIESFIDPVLRLMDKGSSRLQNVQLMRWCREAGVQVAWNVLYGFPGEDAADYAGMVALLPFLAHLDPPQHCGRVRADRHSPYFTYPERYGIRLAVEPAYRFVYPIDTAAVKRIAYYFDMDFSAKRCISEYEELLHRAVEAWRRRAGEGAAFMLQREGTGFVVCDSRLDLPPKCDPATAQEAAVLIACDGTTGLGRVEMLPIWESCPDAPATRAVVERLVARGWLLREGNRLLTLPLLHPDCIGAPADSVGCATTPALTPDVTVAH